MAFSKYFFYYNFRELKVGRPSDKDTKVGALISKEHLAKVKNYVKIAKDEGGVIECGESKDPLLDLPEENKNVCTSCHCLNR